jgi:hypothetical protein
MLYHHESSSNEYAMSAVIKSPTAEVASGSMLDRLGIAVSAFCLVQCLLLPVLVLVSPLTSLGLLGHEAFHLLLLLVIVPVSAAAFALGYRMHRNRAMLVPGLSGLAIVAFAAIFGHDLLGDLGSALVTSFGGLLLITGHWMNLRRRRQAVFGQGPEGGFSQAS